VTPLPLRSAAAIGRALAAGEGSPVALAEELLAGAEAQASPIFLRVTRERALREARAAEVRLRAGRPLSLLDGVPIGWKDLIDMAGERTTAASAIYRDSPPRERDAPVVANAAAAGMVSLGKLNLTEFAYSGLGLNPHFGTPANPNGRGRVPGGSSSGSGVAVAAGLLPCAVGTDTGGSIRVPASFNGIVGYKSSEGRVPKAGVFALSETLDSVGPLARTVEDCVLLDAVLTGRATSAVRRLPLPSLRIFVPEGPVLEDLDPDVAANFDAALARLAAAGARVTRGPMPAFGEAARLAAEVGTITAAEAYVEHRALVDGPARERIDRRVVARIDGGKRMTAHGLITILRARQRLMAELAAHVGDGFIAMPTTPGTAPEAAPLEADDALFHRANLRALRNTMLGNYLNLPGLAIPSGRDAAGLPTGFLLCATGDRDEALLGAGLSAEAIIRDQGE
jgi:aspartyl-tRNA(Asn)/glutamyl-tRNA(Gln) amidotransferase subunit A